MHQKQDLSYYFNDGAHIIQDHVAITGKQAIVLKSRQSILLVALLILELWILVRSQESYFLTYFPKNLIYLFPKILFSEKWLFLTLWYAHIRVRIRGTKFLLFETFGVLCFLLTPVLRFALLPYYGRNVVHNAILFAGFWSVQKTRNLRHNLRWTTGCMGSLN